MSYDPYGHQRAGDLYSQPGRESRPARRYDYDYDYGRYERRDRSYLDDSVYERRRHVARDYRDWDWGTWHDDDRRCGDGDLGPSYDRGELRRLPEDHHDDKARQQERDKQQFEFDLYERDPEKYQEYFYARDARENAGACPDHATRSSGGGSAIQRFQTAATLPGSCTPSATSKGKNTIGTSGPHISQDNRGTRQEESGQAYKNLHQRPSSVNAPQQLLDGNQLQKTEVKVPLLAIPIQSKKDSHVTKDAVRPGLPAVEHHQKKDVGQVSRSLLQSSAPMSFPQLKTTTQGHNSMVQRTPPAIASKSNNVKPSDGAAAQLARLRAEYAQKTQEIHKIQQEYAKLQQAQRMQAIHDEKKIAVNTNPDNDFQSKNDRDQTDTLTVRVTWGKLKDEWEIEEETKAFKRELELFLARKCVPALTEKEPVCDNQLSVPMATAEATQRSLSTPKNDSPTPPQLQELRKRIFDWLEFTDKYSRRRKRSGDHAHTSSPAKRAKTSCPPHNQGGMPSSSSSSSAQTSERSLSLVANHQEVAAARHLNQKGL